MSRAACPLAALLLLPACAAEDAPRRLRVLTQAPVLTIAPQTTDDATTLAVLANVYEALVAFDADGRPVPELAESWSSPADDTWRFRLRGGVRFHDGRPLRAADVEATLARGLASSEPWVRALLPSVTRVAALGEQEVEVRTQGPTPLLLSHLASVMILPAASDPRSPPGTGPYRIAAHGGGRTTLARFEGYWREPPEWDGAVFACEPDGHRRLEAVLRGEADLAEDPPVEELARLQGAKEARLIGLRTPRLAILGFDVRPRDGNPFADARVRFAIALALDREALVKEALGGWAEPAAQFAPPGVFGFVSELALQPPRPAQARAALAAAGYAGGFRSAAFFSGDRNGLLVRALAGQLRGLGVELVPEWRAAQELDALLQAQEAPAFVMHMTFPNHDTSDLLAWGLHSREPTGRYGVLNFSGFSDPELDRLVRASDGTLKPRERYQLLREAMVRALNGRAWIPLCVPHRLYAARAGLRWDVALTGRVRLVEIHDAAAG